MEWVCLASLFRHFVFFLVRFACFSVRVCLTGSEIFQLFGGDGIF